jgi:hypothetical protein
LYAPSFSLEEKMEHVVIPLIKPAKAAIFML